MPLSSYLIVSQSLGQKFSCKLNIPIKIILFISLYLIIYSLKNQNIEKQFLKTYQPRLRKTIEYYNSGFKNVIKLDNSTESKQLKLLIIVISAPSNFEQRLAIRRTWGSLATRPEIKMKFLVGTINSSDINLKLRDESQKFSDIIYSNNIDSYCNLTLKTISMLEYVMDYHPNVPFVLKVDDDVFVNVEKLLGFIKSKNGSRNTIYGELAERWHIIRDIKSKYYVSRNEFHKDYWPKFLVGTIYLITGDLVKKLYHTALNQKFLKLEDVFLTGIVGDVLNVTKVDVNKFANIKVKINDCEISNFMSLSPVSFSRQYDLWKILNWKC